MVNPEAFDLEQCRCSCETVQDLDIRIGSSLNESPNRLIGYGEYADIFESLIPMAEFEDDGSVSSWDDFSEIFPAAFPQTHKTGTAVLLAGETGCGRHTADKTFMSVVLSVLKELYYDQAESGDDPDFNDFLRYYILDFSRFSAETERTLVKIIDMLFEKITSAAVGSPSVLCYFSLGNITPVLENERLAGRFVSRMNRLINDPRANCIVTCVYDGPASRLHDAVKQPFYVLEFDPPEEQSRKEYFQYIIERYPNIRMALEAKELAKETEGFTFAMIKQFVAYVMMSVKAKARREGWELENYLLYATIDDDERIVIDKNKLRRYLAMIKSARYTQPSVPAAAFAAVPSVFSVPVSSGEKNESAKKNGGQAEQKDPEKENVIKVEEKLSSALEEINTPTEFFKARERLMTPAGYAPVILMNRGKLYPQVFEEQELTLSDFLRSCWESGYTDLSNVQSSYIDMNAGVSFRPYDPKQVKPKEKIGLYTEGQGLFNEVILDGLIQEQNMERMGLTMSWMKERLEAHGYRSPSEVFLGIRGENGDLIIYPYE